MLKFQFWMVLFSDDIVKIKRAIKDITERTMIKKRKKKSVVNTGIAGAMSLGCKCFRRRKRDGCFNNSKGYSIVGKTALHQQWLDAYVGIGVLHFIKHFKLLIVVNRRN